ncbi:MAG: tRNA pseudouridine(55) synthase TruB [Granulosicoccus sp.]|nr:tRNA pseudouridine(55) synthase TruB [Granulosicoccus sp.]
MSRRHAKGRAVHGILLLDKPAGGSSNRALQQVKHLFGARKAGHTGSLDPLATGMLPICFGEATKLSGFLLDAAKGYETTLQLGVTTHSADADGEVMETRPVPGNLTQAAFVEVCGRFRGPQQQVPPMVSAIKIDGQRLYKLAREGRDVDRPPRPVVIHELHVLSITGSTARLSIRCSKGTYIRSLVTDIGEAIGCGAHVTSLRRTFVSPFEQQPMVSLEALHRLSAQAALEDSTAAGPSTTGPVHARLDALLLPVDAGMGHLPAVRLGDTALAAFRQGQSAACVPAGDWPGVCQDRLAARSELPYRVYDSNGRLAGLGVLSESGEQVAPRRVLQWD